MAIFLGNIAYFQTNPYHDGRPEAEGGLELSPGSWKDLGSHGRCWDSMLNCGVYAIGSISVYRCI